VIEHKESTCTHHRHRRHYHYAQHQQPHVIFVLLPVLVLMNYFYYYSCCFELFCLEILKTSFLFQEPEQWTSHKRRSSQKEKTGGALYGVACEIFLFKKTVDYCTICDHLFGPPKETSHGAGALSTQLPPRAGEEAPRATLPAVPGSY
jgi:hypothetical protein